MRLCALVLVTLLTGCAGVIMECARACAYANNTRMFRYSQTEGCICAGGERKQ